MTGLLLPKGFVANFGDRLADAAAPHGAESRIPHLPDDPHARLGAKDCVVRRW